MYKLSMASWLPLCVSMHMLVSYNLCSNLGTGYCYENLAGTGGVKGCVCICVCVVCVDYWKSFVRRPDAAMNGKHFFGSVPNCVCVCVSLFICHCTFMNAQSEELEMHHSPSSHAKFKAAEKAQQTFTTFWRKFKQVMYLTAWFSFQLHFTTWFFG